jgi:hypothetical protein
MYKSSKSDVRKKNTFSNGEVGKENNSSLRNRVVKIDLRIALEQSTQHVSFTDKEAGLRG